MASSRGWFPLLACLAVAGLPSSANFREASPWGWRCVNETCIREEDTGQRSLAGLSSCKLTCNRDSVLWPRPTGLLRVGQQTVHFLVEALTLRGVAGPTDEVKQLVKKAFDIFKENVNNNIPETGGKPMVLGPFSRQVTSHRVDVDVTVSRGSTKLLLDTSEAYTLGLTTRGAVTNATILATTFFGARHALETLSQLIEFDDLAGVLEIVSTAAITDVPFFKYRGILLDTARNYFSVKSLERTLDAMAANKLNTFHWHITDSQSFPLYLENLPKMAFFGAYSPRQIYRPADVRHLVEYGRVRGVRVLPEFSAPGHVGNGWQWTEKQGLGKIAVCVNQEPWRSYCSEPPCGQLDVLNNNTFTVLSHIYKEMVNLFSPLDLFHFGGSEVNLNCWNTTDAIVAHLEEAGLGRSAESFYKLWADFQKSAYHLLSEANLGKQIPGILLNSRLTEMDSAESHLDPQHYIIQLWATGGNQTIKNLLQKGFRVIFSNYDAWHLGCGLVNPVSTGENLCSTYKGWQTVYDNSPINIVRNLTGSSHRDLILGGEAALYTHQVDEGTLDSKLWPRGSALAERLWTNPDSTWLAAEARLIHHRQRLVKRGVMAERIQPQWCHQNEGLCYL